MKVTKYSKIIGLICSFIYLCSCHNHIVKKHSTLSHNYTTIFLKKGTSRYKASEQVGGEQINSTLLLAEAGKFYTNEVITNNENFDMHIDGLGCDVEHFIDNKYKRKLYCFDANTIDISFTSYPGSSSYELMISQYIMKVIAI